MGQRGLFLHRSLLRINRMPIPTMTLFGKRCRNSMCLWGFTRPVSRLRNECISGSKTCRNGPCGTSMYTGGRALSRPSRRSLKPLLLRLPAPALVPGLLVLQGAGDGAGEGGAGGARDTHVRIDAQESARAKRCGRVPALRDIDEDGCYYRTAPDSRKWVMFSLRIPRSLRISSVC